MRVASPGMPQLAFGILMFLLFYYFHIYLIRSLFVLSHLDSTNSFASTARRLAHFSQDQSLSRLMALPNLAYN